MHWSRRATRSRFSPSPRSSSATSTAWPRERAGRASGRTCPSGRSTSRCGGPASPARRTLASGSPPWPGSTRQAIPCGVLIAPVLPGLSDHPDQLEAVVDACVEAGAVSVSTNALHLRPGVRQHYLDWLQRTYPDLVDSYLRRYRRSAYLPSADNSAAQRPRGPSGRRRADPSRWSLPCGATRPCRTDRVLAPGERPAPRTGGTDRQQPRRPSSISACDQSEQRLQASGAGAGGIAEMGHPVQVLDRRQYAGVVDRAADRSPPGAPWATTMVVIRPP